MKKTKNVFCSDIFLEWCFEQGMPDSEINTSLDWVSECDGLTQEEVYEKGLFFGIRGWTKEVEI